MEQMGKTLKLSSLDRFDKILICCLLKTSTVPDELSVKFIDYLTISYIIWHYIINMLESSMNKGL